MDESNFSPRIAKRYQQSAIVKPEPILRNAETASARRSQNNPELNLTSIEKKTREAIPRLLQCLSC